MSDKQEHIKRNLFLQLAATAATKLGDNLISVKTILPWIMQTIGAPIALIALLVPVRESGSMLPQMWLRDWVKRFQSRKWVWVIGVFGQSFCVLAMALVVFFHLQLGSVLAGLLLVLCLALFSLFRSLSSLSSKDVLARTMPKNKRGMVTGWSASIAGLLALTAGLLLALNNRVDVLVYVILLLLAMGLWLVGAGLYSLVREPIDQDREDAKANSSTLSFGLLVKDAQLRYFIFVRSMLLSSALVIPFYTMAIQNAYPQLQSLAALIVASSIAAMIGGPVWGRFGDVSSRRVLILAACLCGLVGLGFAAMIILFDKPSQWMMLAGFFILMLAYQGIRVGRKVYVVNMASGDQRTDYVATSNTLIGLLLLLCFFIGWLAEVSSVGITIAGMSCLALLGALFAIKLKEVETDE